MRLFLFATGFMIISAWMNIVFNNYVQFLGIKINWLLVFSIVLSFRFSKLTLSIVGILAGLICDAHSHGIMGLYGFSFFLTTLIVIQIKNILYSNNFFAIGLIVSTMTIIEAWISLTILGWFEPEINKTSLMFNSIFILAILHGFITPIIFKLILWGENIFIGETA